MNGMSFRSEVRRAAARHGAGLCSLVAVAAFSALVVVMMVSSAAAQVDLGTSGLVPEIALRGQGWQQIANTTEMIEFALALLEASVLTAALVYHPVTLAARRSRADFEIPRTMFLYSLVGMLVGFLVMHHGYLIGFVVFGLGGLLRFRTDIESSNDTTTLILVTLVGLSVGLDLPVMALIVTVSAWAVIFLIGRRRHFELEVKFDDKKSTKHEIEALKDALALRGFQSISVTKSKFKPTAQYVLVAHNGVSQVALIEAMTELQQSKQNAVTDWHLD